MGKGRSVVAKGWAWSSLGTFALQASNVVSVVVVSRFLTAEEIGLFVPVAIVGSMASAAADGAFATALVQRKDLVDDHVRVSIWASGITAVVGSVALVAFAGQIEGVFKAPGLAPLLVAASLMLLPRLVATVPASLLQRQLRFRAMAIVGVVTAIAGKIVPTIILAVSGFGAWALVAGYVAQAWLDVVILSWLARPSMAWPRDWRRAYDVLGFGGRFLLIKTMNQAALNIDNLLVGRLLGVAALGLYSRVFALMMLPVNLIGGPAQRVLLPSFSRLQDDIPALRLQFYRAIDLVSILVMPASGMLIVATDSVVLLLLGESWRSIILPTRILFAAVTFRIGYQLAETAAFATAKLTAAALRQVVYAGLIVCGVVLGSRWGLVGVAAGVNGALLVFYLISLHAAARLVRGSRRALAVCHLRGAAMAVFTVAPASLVSRLGSDSLQGRIMADIGAGIVFFGLMALVLVRGPRTLTGTSAEVISVVVRRLSEATGYRRMPRIAPSV